MRVENDLKPHNIETVKRILEFFENGNKCCAIQATGTGKTFLILRLLEVFNDEDKKAIILAPNNEIIKQTKKRMKKFGLNNATFYTYQKLARMSKDEIKEIKTDLIVCDELHRTGAALWGAKFEILVATHSNAKIFGATATALRCTDGRDMAEEYFDNNKACDISLAEALVRKIIPVMPLYVSALYTFEEEYQKLYDKIEIGNNTKEEKEQLQKELSAAKKQLEKANGVPEIIKKHIINYNGKYIVFCKNKEHLYAMKDIVIGWFRESGYKGKIYEYPYYSNNSDVKKNLTNFESNNEKGLKLLFVIDKLNEGLHLDEIHGCILLRTTVSNIIYYQQIGRAIDAGSTEQRVILDLVSNFNNLESFNFKKELQEKTTERQNGAFNECSIDFDVDEFNVVDYIQECIDIFNKIDSQITGRKWTEEEDEIILKYYKQEGSQVYKRLSNRTSFACIHRAKNLGLTENNLWSEEEDKILLREFNNGKIAKEITLLIPNRTEEGIVARMAKLGLIRSQRWTEEEKTFIKDNYSSCSIKDIATRLQRSESGIRQQAYKLGLCQKYTHDVDQNTVNFVINNYNILSVDEIANKLELSRHMVQKIAKDNKLNSKKRITKGYYLTQKNKYCVSFFVDGKMHNFGTYETEEEAAKVAMEKAKEYGKTIQSIA